MQLLWGVYVFRLDLANTAPCGTEDGTEYNKYIFLLYHSVQFQSRPVVSEANLSRENALSMSVAPHSYNNAPNFVHLKCVHITCPA